MATRSISEPRRRVRPLVLAWLAACGGAPPVVVTAPTCPSLPQEAPHEEPRVEPHAASAASERRAALRRELAAIDRELDAIDTALAFAGGAGMSRVEARARIDARRATLRVVQAGGVPAETPAPVRLLAAAVVAAHAHVLDLARELGDRNPDLVTARAELASAETELAHQLASELAELDAWDAELGKLPATAKPDLVHAAQLAALRTVISGPGDVAPSDAPARWQLAAARAWQARRVHEELARAGLGPKHPDLVRANVELEATEHELPAARAAALDALSTPAVQHAIDISRRAELAAQAAALRAGYEALP
jgi:hypothetical protein